MPTWALVGLLVVGVVALDRLLLAAERRGWVYWPRSPPHRTTAGMALQRMEALFRLEVEHTVEERAAVELDEDEDGEPPCTGWTGRSRPHRS